VRELGRLLLLSTNETYIAFRAHCFHRHYHVFRQGSIAIRIPGTVQLGHVAARSKGVNYGFGQPQLS